VFTLGRVVSLAIRACVVFHGAHQLLRFTVFKEQMTKTHKTAWFRVLFVDNGKQSGNFNLEYSQITPPFQHYTLVNQKQFALFGPEILPLTIVQIYQLDVVQRRVVRSIVGSVRTHNEQWQNTMQRMNGRLNLEFAMTLHFLRKWSHRFSLPNSIF